VTKEARNNRALRRQTSGDIVGRAVLFIGEVPGGCN
jgi:hypothetical protein